MLILFIRVAAAMQGYMAAYMPTNRAVAWLRSPRGLKWAIPVALVATPSYLFAMSVCRVIIERGGPGYLNVLVLLFAWNALKFVAMGLVSAPMMLRGAVARQRIPVHRPAEPAHQGISGDSVPKPTRA